MATTESFVKLVEGVAKDLHFADHALTMRPIRDPVTGFTRDIQVLSFAVDEEDGQSVNRVYDITSGKHRADFEPLLEGRVYRHFTFRVTVRGVSFARSYTVERFPRST
mgnify:CR=1 FL=1